MKFREECQSLFLSKAKHGCRRCKGGLCEFLECCMVNVLIFSFLFPFLSDLLGGCSGEGWVEGGKGDTAQKE